MAFNARIDPHEEEQAPGQFRPHAIKARKIDEK
jgi:hypothetical protein